MTDQEILARAITLAMGPEHELVDRLAAVLRKHDDEHYKLSWQVRDTCARAEAAEAERDTLLAQVGRLTGILKEIADQPESYSERCCGGGSSYGVGYAFHIVKTKASAALTKEPS